MLSDEAADRTWHPDCCSGIDAARARSARVLDPRAGDHAAIRGDGAGLEHRRRSRQPDLAGTRRVLRHRRLHFHGAAAQVRHQPVARHARWRRTRRPRGVRCRDPHHAAARPLFRAGDARLWRGDAGDCQCLDVADRWAGRTFSAVLTPEFCSLFVQVASSTCLYRAGRAYHRDGDFRGHPTAARWAIGCGRSGKILPPPR